MINNYGLKKGRDISDKIIFLKKSKIPFLIKRLCITNVKFFIKIVFFRERYIFTCRTANIIYLVPLIILLEPEVTFRQGKYSEFHYLKTQLL